MAYDTQRDGPGSYNGFSKADRYASMAIYRRESAKARAGLPSLFPALDRCMLCGQTQGQIEWHTEDYNAPFGKTFCEWVLCYRCHTMLHCAAKNRRAWEDYLTIVQSGWIFPPTPSPRQRGWPIVLRENLPEKAQRCLPLEGDLFISKTEGLTWVGEQDCCLDRMLAAGVEARRRRDELGPVVEQMARASL